MPRKKKELTDKELSKIREVEAYEHDIRGKGVI